MRLQLSILALLVALLPCSQADRESILFDFGWRFYRGSAPTECPASAFPTNLTGVECVGKFSPRKKKKKKKEKWDTLSAGKILNSTVSGCAAVGCGCELRSFSDEKWDRRTFVDKRIVKLSRRYVYEQSLTWPARACFRVVFSGWESRCITPQSAQWCDCNQLAFC